MEDFVHGVALRPFQVNCTPPEHMPIHYKQGSAWCHIVIGSHGTTMVAFRYCDDEDELPFEVDGETMSISSNSDSFSSS